MFPAFHLQSLAGVALVLLLCYLFSENKRRPPLLLILGGLAIQVGLIVLLFAFPQSHAVLTAIADGVGALDQATGKGAQFVFGYLGGGSQPYALVDPKQAPFVFAFKVFPLILVISSLAALLWHIGLLKLITRVFGFVFEKTMGLGGATALSVASNIFLGNIEAQIVIRAYLSKLTRSELFVLMCVGLSCVSGSTMIAYVAILSATLPNAAGHVLAASIISAPAGVMLARLMIPETERTSDSPIDYESDLKYNGAVDAVVSGVSDGLKVVTNIAGMLIVIVAFSALFNLILSVIPPVGGAPITVERVLSYILAPLAWAIGVAWPEAQKAGWLLGVKFMQTEFVAFIDLGQTPVGALSDRTRMLLTYALCGFANIASVGISVGGLSQLMPERKSQIVSLIWPAVFAGFLATCLTASVVGVMPDALFRH